LPVSSSHAKEKLSLFGKVRAVFRLLKQVTLLTKYLWKIKPNVVYKNTGIIDRAALACFILRINHIWHFREYGPLDYSIYPELGYKLFRFQIALSTCVIANSNSVFNYHFRHLQSSKKEVVYNGVFLPDIYKAHDVYVQPSIGDELTGQIESFGVSILEAIAVGLYVIGTRSGGSQR
jgi:hypothetical protein